MISVVILTHNRLPLLRECVESICRNGIEDYEIIIVDNASTDGTYEEFTDTPGVRVIRFAKNTQLSSCRNAGIDAARGDIIAFTDDDCLVERNWLQRIEEDLAKYDAVGGIARAWGAIPTPWWWHDELNWMVGLSVPGHYGPEAGIVYLPGSLNLAYRAGVLKKLRFKEDVDGIGDKNMTREDSDLWMRTRAQEYTTFFDTELAVYHRVPRRRFTLPFCLRRAFSDGFAAYHREDGATAWRAKLGFLAREPFRIIQRKLRREGGSRTHELFWIIRESGFVFAHLRRVYSVSAGSGQKRRPDKGRT
jgi:glycosyltransferase involved in cell wall biosynthesis